MSFCALYINKCRWYCYWFSYTSLWLQVTGTNQWLCTFSFHSSGAHCDPFLFSLSHFPCTVWLCVVSLIYESTLQLPLNRLLFINTSPCRYRVQWQFEMLHLVKHLQCKGVREVLMHFLWRYSLLHKTITVQCRSHTGECKAISRCLPCFFLCRLFDCLHWATSSCCHWRHSNTQVQLPNRWQPPRDRVVSGEHAGEFMQ